MASRLVGDDPAGPATPGQGHEASLESRKDKNDARWWTPEREGEKRAEAKKSMVGVLLVLSFIFRSSVLSSRAFVFVFFGRIPSRQRGGGAQRRLTWISPAIDGPRQKRGVPNSYPNRK